ncbi:hypothetical protein AKJ08_0029 [Vulgatibacter incomptus]|uniref:Uncharacterized protein n=1 Tax=Vulgatibacter incomptus TaxID=1391653 RepID=A0A0K1P804_9BACT|nr:hypothetical protein AKJ08_0029 [Vulgatibacter incomptus]
MRRLCLPVLLSFSVAACGGGGGNDSPGGTGGTVGTGGSGGEGTGGTGGEGTGGTGGEATGGTGGEATGGSGGEGTGGSGGEGTGGTGGSEEPACVTDEECAPLAADQCVTAVCNDGRYEGPVGVCVQVPLEAGTACDDGLFCTLNDVCDGEGVCVGTTPNDCGLEPASCQAVACDEDSQTCDFVAGNEGGSCDSGDLCEVGSCHAGECVGAPKSCAGLNGACTVGVCNPADGSCEAEPVDAGTSCSLFGLGQCEFATCNATGTCEAHPVAAGTSCNLPNLGQCEVATCNAAGACESDARPDGSACNSGNPCTTGDACVAGSCSGTYDEATCTANALHYSENFEDCAASGWTFTRDWQCGTPANVGPACHGGTGCFATQLAAQYSPDQSFDTTTATSPVIDLSRASDPRLSFWAWVDTEGDNNLYDGFNVKARRVGETDFTVLHPEIPGYRSEITGQPAWGGRYAARGWQPYRVDLSEYAGSEIEIQFGFRSDGSLQYDGVFIDDVQVSEAYGSPNLVLRTELPSAIVGQGFAARVWSLGASNSEWAIVGGNRHEWLSIDPTSGFLFGTPVDAGQTTVTVRVRNAWYPANVAEKTFTIDVRDYGSLLLWADDFESCDWTLRGDWECGTPGAFGPEYGPYSGSSVLATKLEGAYSPDQAYVSATADSPFIDLSQAESPLLQFYVWRKTENPDAFNLKVSTDGMSFTQLMSVSPAYDGTQANEPAWSGDKTAAGWQRYSVDLSAYAGEQIQLRFAFRSDSSGEMNGVFIDDLRIIESAVNPLVITTSVLPDANTGLPFLGPVRKTGGSLQTVWSIVGGTNAGWLTIDPATGNLSGTPGAGNLGAVSVTVRAVEPLAPSNQAEKTLTFAVVEGTPGVYMTNDLENCAGLALRGDWQCGTPTNVGPATCHSGTSCLATRLDDVYNNNQAYETTTADLSPISLSGAVAPKLFFWAWIQTESGAYDAFNVKTSGDGTNFAIATDVTPAYNGTAANESAWYGQFAAQGWRRFEVDLSRHAGGPVWIRFAFRSDGSGQHPGIYIDDLSISEADADPVGISTSPNLGSAFVDRPFQRQLTKQFGSPASSWSFEGAHPTWLQLDPATGALRGTPDAASVGTVTFTVRVEEPSRPDNFATKTFTLVVDVLPVGTVHVDDLEGCGGWTLHGDWECGTPSIVGPSSCHSGQSCLATKLASEYSNSQAWASATADARPIDLSSVTSARLSFWAWVHTEGPRYDAFNVKLSADGTNWTLATDERPAYDDVADSQPGWGGDHSAEGWKEYSVDLSRYAGGPVYVRFAWRTDSSGTRAGVFIDDLKVIDAAYDPISIAAATLPSGVVGQPYQATFRKSGGSTTPVWSLVGNHPSWLSIDPATGTLGGTPTAAGEVTVTVRVQETTLPSNSAETTASFLVRALEPGVFFVEDFSNCPAGWTLTGDWECGVPSNVGPASCRSGGNCLATKLDGNYTQALDAASDYAESPPILLPEGTSPVLTFWAWVQTYSNRHDWFDVRARRTSETLFTFLDDVSPPYVEGSWGGDLSQLGWRQYTVDLSAYAGDSIVLRFPFESGRFAAHAGVYIDGIAIREASNVMPAIAESDVAPAIVGVPYVARLQKSGGPEQVSWSITGGENYGWLSIDPETGVLSGTAFPADAGPVSVTVRVEDPSNPLLEDERTLGFTVFDTTVHLQESFESCPNGWTLTGDWECGVPTNGPGAAYEGQQCIATRLGGNYSDSMSWGMSTATSPEIDLTGSAHPAALFRLWVMTEGGSWDGTNLKVSTDGGETFTAVTSVSPGPDVHLDGQPAWGGDHIGSGWRLVQADLTEYAGQIVQLRFDFRSDGGVNFEGAYIDDLVVIDVPALP